MKALMYEGAWQMPLREVADPVVEPGWLVVDVKAVAVCGSDVHGFKGITGRRTPPIIMGHEFSGVVAEVGEGVKRFNPGDRIAGQPIWACGECFNCQAGLPNICSNRRVLGVNLHGAYAEKVRLAEDMAYAIPDDMPWEIAALVEPVAVGMHAVNISPIRLFDTVVIIGAGMIGLTTLISARLKGAGKIVISDKSPHRLEIAKRLGADVTVNIAEADPVHVVQELTGAKGADVVIEAVGLSSAVKQSLALVRTGGHVTWVGNAQPNVEINMQQIVTREVTVRGSYGFHHEFGKAIELIHSGRVDVRPLIEKIAPLAEGSEMIRALAAEEMDLMKVVLTP